MEGIIIADLPPHGGSFPLWQRLSLEILLLPYARKTGFEMAKWVNGINRHLTCATLISTGFVRNILLEL